jgi:hypothetical protein
VFLYHTALIPYNPIAKLPNTTVSIHPALHLSNTASLNAASVNNGASGTPCHVDAGVCTTTVVAPLSVDVLAPCVRVLLFVRVGEWNVVELCVG